ncbi:alpha/beta hydrolase [Falsiroseomonas selenitidurans]|uniref:Alpha/beta hydrolase n=1 Tax=Falsiroseomonas selenitidurans TaxID=2716335 RepID=A0ABX1EBH8_9PROT|nr:alpha/beta hydrolase [Falsiroseomonas selenitidurans]NKC34594.1 alpha/beta hydrolase [Falsiroseomonas selenitidurans]
MSVTVYFATNRNLDDEAEFGFGNQYNPDGPYCVRYGAAEVTVPVDRLVGEYRLESVSVAPESIPGLNADPAAPVVRGSDRVFDGLRDRLRANGADLLILLHGFSCSFRDSLERAAQLREVYSTAARPLEVAVFAWPSDGRILMPDGGELFKLSYFSDRTDAEASREAIARSLRRIIDYFRNLPRGLQCGQRMHLMAHSMGNYVLRHAVQSFARDFKPGGMPRLFESIFLMAADEDDDAFECGHKFARLPELAASVHVYFAANDGALGISDLTKGNPDRLGQAGPRTLTDLPRKVVLVDCAAVSDINGLTDAHHQYYRSRAEVVADVQAVLAGRRPDEIPQRVFAAAARAFRLMPVR